MLKPFFTRQKVGTQFQFTLNNCTYIHDKASGSFYCVVYDPCTTDFLNVVDLSKDDFKKFIFK